MIMRLTLIAVAFVLGLSLAPERAVRLDPGVSVAEAGFGGRGGGRMRGGGISGHRGGHGIKARPSRPHGGAKLRPRPNRGGLANRPNRPETRPAQTRPAAGNRPNRPNAGNRPRPVPGNRPNRPTVGGGNVNIGSGNVVVNRPVIRPAIRPGVRPPHYRPPYWRPPGWRPPYVRPPYVRPPHWRWGDYHYYPAWGWYFTAVVAGATLVYVADLPEDDGCEPVKYEDETLYECDGVLYRSTLYEDEEVYEIVSSEEESEQAASAPAGGGAEAAPGDALFLTSPMMRGNQVKAVQVALGALGYDVGTPDGVFGSGTDRAVRAFQRDQGVPETGIVAGETREKLGL